MTARDGEVVYVVPLGEPPSDKELGGVASALEGVLGLACRIGARVDPPALALNAPRGQHNSSAILSELASEFPSGATRVLGVTYLDLYVPGLNFVFGEAEVGGRCATISLCRLREEYYGRPPDARLSGERAAKEAVHETGHMLGLTHCPDSDCVMHFSNTLEDTDRKSKGLCRACRDALDMRLGGM